MISLIIAILSIIPIIVVLYLDKKLENDMRRFSAKMRKEAESERLKIKNQQIK